MKKSRIMLLVALALCLCACGAMESGLPQETEDAKGQTEPALAIDTQVPETTEAPDYSVPDFVMEDLEGNRVSLSDFEGKPVILNFWTSWCGPCKSEMPDIEQAYQRYADQIHFVIVNLTDGTSETVESASSYIAGQGYTFPVYYDTAMEGAYAFGVRSIPITFFIDANGDLVTYYMGTMSADVLQQGIDYLLPEG